VSRRARSSRAVPVLVEAGARRVFACASDWPGWCRSGKDEKLALENLAGYARRYAAVAKEAGLRFPPGDADEVVLEVVERLPGGPTTDFGAPQSVADSDRRRLTPKQSQANEALVRAAWTLLDGVVANAPASLRKGPRGGGRDRDAIFAHVLSAEVMYARKLGIRVPEPDPSDRKAVSSFRDSVVAVLASTRAPAPLVEKGWPVAYAARRIAWHVLDHAWEIEDRST